MKKYRFKSEEDLKAFMTRDSHTGIIASINTRMAKFIDQDLNWKTPFYLEDQNDKKLVKNLDGRTFIEPFGHFDSVDMTFIEEIQEQVNFNVFESETGFSFSAYNLSAEQVKLLTNILVK